MYYAVNLKGAALHLASMPIERLIHTLGTLVAAYCIDPVGTVAQLDTLTAELQALGATDRAEIAESFRAGLLEGEHAADAAEKLLKE